MVLYIVIQCNCCKWLLTLFLLVYYTCWLVRSICLTVIWVIIQLWILSYIVLDFFQLWRGAREDETWWTIAVWSYIHACRPTRQQKWISDPVYIIRSKVQPWSAWIKSTFFASTPTVSVLVPIRLMLFHNTFYRVYMCLLRKECSTVF